MLMRVVPDLTTPSWEGLSYLLRHRELWPEDFEWYFPSQTTCAIGLASRVMGDFPKVSMRCAFAVNPYAWSTYDPYHKIIVTPEMVADKIDELLAKE